MIWLVFRARRTWLRLTLGSGAATRSAGATVAVMRTAAVAVIFAGLLIAVLYAVERWRFSILQFLHLDSGWAGRQARRPLNGSSYDTALQTIGGVGGVFVALYFATISGIVGGIYAQTPHNIRDLVLGDRIGRSYIRIIATLTALAALLGLIRAAGARPWHTAIVALALLVGVGVFAFVALLRRAFYFFDVTILAPRVAEDFLRWAERAARKGAATSDRNLQAEFRQQAEAAISALEAIVDVVTAKERIDAEPIRRLAQNITVMSRRYAHIKQRIPTGSLWFGQRARHTQWYLSSAPAVSVAASTFTSIPPQAAPDPLWVEERVAAAQLALLGALLA